MPEVIEQNDARHIAINCAVHLHSSAFSAREDTGQAVTETATTIYRWLIQPVPDPTITALQARIDALEERMTASETALQALDAATNEVATELEELRDLIASTDAATAARIQAAADRLRGLAADPENPVPEPEVLPDEPV